MRSKHLAIVISAVMGFSLFGCQQGDPNPHFDKGVAYFQQGDTVKATAEFEQAIKVKRNFAPGYYNLGICNLKPGSYEQANQYFLKAVKYDPSYVDAYYSSSMVQITLNALPEAKNVLYQGIKKNPRASMLYYNLGYIFLLKGETDSARWAYKKVMEIDPGNSDGYFNFAYASNDPQYSQEAIDALRQAVNVDSLNYKAHYLLGTKLLGKNNRTPEETKEGRRSLEIFLKCGKGIAQNIDLAKELMTKTK